MLLTIQVVFNVSRRGWDRGLTRLQKKEHKIQLKLLTTHYYSHLFLRETYRHFYCIQNPRKDRKIREISLQKRFLRERRGKNSLKLCSQAFEVLLPVNKFCFAIRWFSGTGSKATGSKALGTALIYKQHNDLSCKKSDISNNVVVSVTYQNWVELSYTASAFVAQRSECSQWHHWRCTVRVTDSARESSNRISPERRDRYLTGICRISMFVSVQVFTASVAFSDKSSSWFRCRRLIAQYFSTLLVNILIVYFCFFSPFFWWIKETATLFNSSRSRWGTNAAQNWSPRQGNAESYEEEDGCSQFSAPKKIKIEEVSNIFTFTLVLSKQDSKIAALKIIFIFSFLYLFLCSTSANRLCAAVT